jgi:HlyD family secretion protein
MSRRTTTPAFSRTGIILALALPLAGLALVSQPLVASLLGRRPTLEGIRTTLVGRSLIDRSILAPGRVASTQSTEIRCTLERLDSAGAGTSPIGGSSTILSLVPDGSIVKAGDVLCELDSSTYQELVRRQQITVEQARADRMQAQLALDVAELSLQSYREGLKAQTERELLGQLALMRSDQARQVDRIAWARRMLEKGYVSLAQVRTEEQSQSKLDWQLEQIDTSLDIFRRFTVPKELLAYSSQVIGARSTLKFQTIRLNREEERLAHYTKQMEACTIRAPHGGFVIHANRPGRDPRVYEGAPVRERMKLFDLPDQTKLEVEVLLHETVVNHVRAGMDASALIEALPRGLLRGRVDSVGPVPMSDQNAESGSNIAYFLAHIRLDDIPPGLRPGMTAQVSILPGPREVLALPIESVQVEDHREFCLVSTSGRIERRALRLGQADERVVEVLEGVREGEQVVLDPTTISHELTALPATPANSPAVTPDI